MREIARVENVGSKGTMVSVKRRTACGDSCATCPSRCKTQNNKILVNNNIGAKPGDYVEIEISTKNVLGSAFLVYLLPLIVFFAGYLIAEYLTKSEIIALIFGIIPFTLAFLFLHIWDKKHKMKIDIVNILEK